MTILVPFKDAYDCHPHCRTMNRYTGAEIADHTTDLNSAMID